MITTHDAGEVGLRSTDSCTGLPAAAITTDGRAATRVGKPILARLHRAVASIADVGYGGLAGAAVTSS